MELETMLFTPLERIVPIGSNRTISAWLAGQFGLCFIFLRPLPVGDQDEGQVDDEGQDQVDY